MDSILRIIVIASFVFALLAGMLTFDYYKKHDLILARTIVGDVQLGGLTKTKARAALKERWTQLSQAPVQLAVRGEVQPFTLEELGVLFNDNALIESLPTSKKVSTLTMIVKGMFGRRYFPSITISRTQMEQLIYKKFPTLPAAQNAHLVLGKNGFEVTEGITGLKPVVGPLAASLEKDVTFFETHPLIVDFEDRSPDITAQDLAPFIEVIKNRMGAPLKFTYDKQNWQIDLAKHIEFIRFARPEKVAEVSGLVGVGASADFPFVMYWDASNFNKFIDEKIALSVDQKPEDVSITKEGEKISIVGHGVDGRAVDRDALYRAVAQVLNPTPSTPATRELAVPTMVVSARVDIALELQDQGIRELVGMAYTRYDGSPPNRQHNVTTGTNKFNGILIPQGAVFSFDENIGPVDGENGYLKELVIKPEGTIPEYGGGLCQVSTTLYRAALYTGLPIVDRRPHSYAVSYYAQVAGHGLDATVYPPNIDMKFKNDTAGPLLIQSYTIGTSAYFKFYGTKDTRTVAMEGPFISNHRSAPAEVLEVPDAKLKPGQRKQVEKPHPGFDALWRRSVTMPNGDVLKEDIKSRYRATQAKFLVGGPVVPVKTDGGDVNPFE